MHNKNDNKIIVALDYEDSAVALQLAKKLDPALCRLKIGSILFTRCGPLIISALQKLGFEIFLDLKFHDIPNTVAQACVAAAELGVWMLTLHTMGGKEMMQAAAYAVANSQSDCLPLLVGVTVLTSMADGDLSQLSIPITLPELVSNLANLAEESGLDGVVCSPLEVADLRQNLPPDFLLVTPGIRLDEGDKHDQKRTMTPAAALKNGANYLVIGRAITQAANPQLALDTILASIC